MSEIIQRKSNAGQVLGIVGLILGIISLLIAFIPCIGVMALLPGGIAILLCLIGLAQANNNDAPKGLLITALIISFIATSIAGLWGLVLSEGSDWEHWKDKIEILDDLQDLDGDSTLDNLEDDMDKLEDDDSNTNDGKKNDTDGNTLDDLEDEMDNLEDNDNVSPDNNVNPDDGKSKDKTIVPTTDELRKKTDTDTNTNDGKSKDGKSKDGKSRDGKSKG